MRSSGRASTATKKIIYDSPIFLSSPSIRSDFIALGWNQDRFVQNMHALKWQNKLRLHPIFEYTNYDLIIYTLRRQRFDNGRFLAYVVPHLLKGPKKRKAQYSSWRSFG